MTPENKSLRDDFTNATPTNQLEFIIKRTIREMVNTAALVRVDACASSGPEGPAGEVSATPLVSQTDPAGNALPMASIPRLPHYRVQGGVAALIIDPVPGDIGVAVFCKDDSSGVEPGASRPRVPASFRQYSQSDGMLVGSVSNKAPEVWIELKQDRTITIHAPEGVTIETEKTLTLSAGQAIILDTPQTRVNGNLTASGQRGGVFAMTGNMLLNGSLTSSGDQVANGISQLQHIHEGVEPGSGTTGAPIG